MKKRIISVLMVLSMVLALLPTTVFAWSEQEFTTLAQLTEKIRTFDGSDSLRMTYRGAGDLVIKQDMTIPYKLDVSVYGDTGDKKIIIASGADVVVAGELHGDHVVVEKGATLTIVKNGFFRCDETMLIDGTFTGEEGSNMNWYCDVTVNGKFYHNGWIACGYKDVSITGEKNVVRGAKSEYDWTIEVKNSLELERAIELSQGKLSQGNDRVRIRIEGDWDKTKAYALGKNAVLNRNTSLEVNRNAILTIAPGCTLTTEGEVWVSGEVKVRGALKNNGMMELSYYDPPGGKLTLAPGGKYSQGERGQICVTSDGNRTSPRDALEGIDLSDFYVNGDADSGWWLQLKSGSTTGAGTVPPAGQLAPEGLSAETVGLSIRLTWAAEPGVTKYAVYRKSYETDGQFKWLASTTTTSYLDKDVQGSRYYEYKVCCYKPAGGVGELSDAVETRLYIPGPENLTLKYIDGKVKATWDAVEGVNSYRLCRYLWENNTWDYEESIYVTGTTYTDDKVVEGKTYGYEVVASGESFGEGVFSKRIKITCGIPVMPVPAKPYKIANVVSGVHVYWKEVAGADKYGLWRSETGKNGTYKWVANPTVPHFTDTKVESGKTYFYKVTSMDVETETHSVKSEAIGIVYTSTPDITERYNIAAGVQLGWEKIPGATGYAIYRKSYSGTDAWARVGTIEGNETFIWIDESVKNNNGSEYRYTIRALGGADMKTLSGCRNTGRTMVRLSSQVLKSAVKADETSIKCTWTTSKMVTGYEVRFLVGNEVFKTFTVGNYKTGVKTFTGLKAGEDYIIQVRTYKKVAGVGSFYSDWSVHKSVSL